MAQKYNYFCEPQKVKERIELNVENYFKLASPLWLSV